jgi:hypothetical protein
MARKKHVTITPAQAESIRGMGMAMHGAGMIPSNFDDDDPQWADHTFVDFPIYVSKGRGKYHGQGGGLGSHQDVRAAAHPSWPSPTRPTRMGGGPKVPVAFQMVQEILGLPGEIGDNINGVSE